MSDTKMKKPISLVTSLMDRISPPIRGVPLIDFQIDFIQTAQLNTVTNYTGQTHYQLAPSVWKTLGLAVKATRQLGFTINAVVYQVPGSPAYRSNRFIVTIYVTEKQRTATYIERGSLSNWHCDALDAFSDAVHSHIHYYRGGNTIYMPFYWRMEHTLRDLAKMAGVADCTQIDILKIYDIESPIQSVDRPDGMFSIKHYHMGDTV